MVITVITYIPVDCFLKMLIISLCIISRTVLNYAVKLNKQLNKCCCIC